MFTLKFMKHQNPTTVFCAPKYEILREEDEIIVSIFKCISSSNSDAEMYINKEEFDVCFIENLSGKTIDKLSV